MWASGGRAFPLEGIVSIRVEELHPWYVQGPTWRQARLEQRESQDKGQMMKSEVSGRMYTGPCGWRLGFRQKYTEEPEQDIDVIQLIF